MITVEPLVEWKDRHQFEAVEDECEECEGEGDCPSCGHTCEACGGLGRINKEMSEREIEARYFHEVMESLKRLCAFSSRHDFLQEAGDVIKAIGRLDLPPWHRTVH